DRSTVHVLDASRVVDVVSNLLSEERRSTFEQENRALQQRLRDQHGARRERPLLRYEQALANRLAIDPSGAAPPQPPFFGRRVLADVPLAELRPYIDWTFFFAAWDLKGHFPAILEHPKYGEAARELYDNAQLLLERIARENLLTASGVYGFWPAAGEDDDVVGYRDVGHRGELGRVPMLRQQEAMAGGQRDLAPAGFRGPTDYIGAFAVTAGLGADDLARRLEREHDDYSAILVKALADRLAEAFATYLHRTTVNEAGIRPAFGYPACPDHSETFTLFSLV